jgi:hypothetical protein
MTLEAGYTTARETAPLNTLHGGTQRASPRRANDESPGNQAWHGSWIGLLAMRNLVIALCASIVACTDTYHPEYHPVTVTTVNQSLNTPTVIAPPAAVIAAPSGVTPIVVTQPALADPNLFFGAR